MATKKGYTLEWKVYGHDGPDNLVSSLTEAGFEIGDLEKVLVARTSDLSGTEHELELPKGAVIESIVDELGLGAVVEISRDIGRRNADSEARRLQSVLQSTPEEMSVYVVKFNGEPVSCGRSYYPSGEFFAELAGGRTKIAHRGRGFFSALVRHRLIEARLRGYKFALVDALPTSEPILKRLGFWQLTETRPFVFEPVSELSKELK